MAEYICADLSERPGCKVSPFWERRERVVRCRDCVHWRRPTDRERSRCTGDMAFMEPAPDGFCAWGVPRKED